MITELKLPQLELEIQRLQTQIKELKNICLNINGTVSDNGIEYIPLSEILHSKGKKRLMSAPKFYQLVKQGKINICKVGSRTYVDKIEFNRIFKPIQVDVNKISE